MAAVSSLNAVTGGIAQFLGRAYQVRPIADVSCTFASIGITGFKKLDGQETTCSLLLYRVTHNEHMRNRIPAGHPVPLTVNLHLLVTVWADGALKEQTLLGWILREMHKRPVLDQSVLGTIDGFAPSDQIQLVPEELSIDDMTKLWQVLVPPYRPSLTYVARNVPIDIDPDVEYAPVVATRQIYTDRVPEEVPAP